MPDLVACHHPGLHGVVRVWHHAAPAVALVLAGSSGLSIWRVRLHAGLGLAPHVRRSTIGSTPGGYPAS